ncbi:autotransporter outer membrane beta-barrel domain-containing protein [Methylotenera sp.]|uniref:autotransporter family protein n=1 Tax=Methylotenera sp. TaxID=2051956 RepID=UPI002489DB10|nr:autotransporter outer membrane beta-barrel domain-containing protein [Methylotenera sp.]MDI1298690.1 autotransporter domain-containing protein [Methylotenera sp.]
MVIQNSNTRINQKIHLAVLAALPMLALASLNASAACTGSIATPATAAGAATSISVLCNGTGSSGNLTNGAGTTLVDNTTVAGTSTAPVVGNNVLLQFDGHGRTLNNTGDIINNRVITGTTGSRGRTAVLMGGATLNASEPDPSKNDPGTLLTTNLPATGATTVTLNAAPTTAYVGQTIVVGRYDGDDFANGTTRIITAVDVVNKTVTFADALPADYAGTGTDSVAYKVVSNYGATSTIGGETYNNVINNSGTISSRITAAEIIADKTGSGPFASVSNTASVKGITMSVEGDYLINNNKTGVISVKHDGIGAAYAIEQGGAVEGLVINNSGLISAERTAALTLVNNTATANPTATASIGGNTFSAQTVALVNAINTQEEAEELTLNNSETGIVRATGDYAAAIYMRAGEKTIVNEGLIEYVGNKGFAIGAVSDPGDPRTLELENAETGIIRGDILVTNGNALRYYLLSTEGGLSGLDSRLTINSHVGQSDSEIENEGQIIGNLYFSNGTHVLTNEETGVITGNIDLDQRNTYSASGNGTLLGTKDFTYENAGTYSGNITIRTAANSNATLIPTITGSGAGSTLASPSPDIAGMGNVLTIDATAGAGTVTVAPKTLVTVKAGEYFKVANTLTLTGGATTPVVDSINTPLVNWTISTNASNNLVIGVDTINSATTITGVSAGSAAAIDALINSNASTVGGALQSSTITTAQLNTAGQQLRPEANNASMQATIAAVDHVSALIVNHQEETRVASKENSGISTGESVQGVGVWMQGFGFKGDQNKRNSIDGYTANTGGFAVGADTVVGNGDFRVGGALAYASTGIDGDGATQANRTDIDSYQGTLYGSWNAGAWYLDAALGYGRHQYDTKRFVSLVNASVIGSHDADQYLAKIGGGYPIQLGKVTITPMASLTYVKLDQSSYTEKDHSNSGAALSVASVDSDSFRSGLGAKISAPLSSGKVKTTADARLMWNHEFADTNQDVAARFAGGTSFTTNGMNQSRDSANIGLGINFISENHQNLSVNYDAEVKSGYVGHTGSIKLRIDF